MIRSTYAHLVSVQEWQPAGLKVSPSFRRTPQALTSCRALLQHQTPYVTYCNKWQTRSEAPLFSMIHCVLCGCHGGGGGGGGEGEGPGRTRGKDYACELTHQCTPTFDWLLACRGQVVRVKAPWIKHYYNNNGQFYIIPNLETVVLGGTTQKGNWDTSINEQASMTLLPMNLYT